jgi:transposase-like protein
MTKELSHIYDIFPTQKDCIDFLERILWKKGPVCPYCQTDSVTPMRGENRYHCNLCNSGFSVTVLTIFHKTRCDLQKWFLAALLINNALKKIPARQLAEKLEVTKDTAWRMLEQMNQNRRFSEFLAQEVNTLNTEYNEKRSHS